MKRLIFIGLILIFLILVGCSKDSSDTQVSKLDYKSQEVYSKNDSQEVKNILKSYKDIEKLTTEELDKKEILVIDCGKFVCNKEVWNNFCDAVKNKKESAILILQYTEKYDPILTYLSYKDNIFFMIEDESRDEFSDIKKQEYLEYTFKYLKIFDENNKTYVYLLNDDKVTLQKLNFSLFSSNTSDWIPYAFVFSYVK